MTPTPCETCDFVHMDTRRLSFYKWMCVKFPRLEGMSAVAPTQAVRSEPYNKCVNVNLGFCPLWTARREGPKND